MFLKIVTLTKGVSARLFVGVYIKSEFEAVFLKLIANDQISISLLYCLKSTLWWLFALPCTNNDFILTGFSETKI